MSWVGLGLNDLGCIDLLLYLSDFSLCLFGYRTVLDMNYLVLSYAR